MQAELSGNPKLIAIIRREIAREGPMRFDRFMELALYHSRHGYYVSGRAQIGRHGDFYTNVSVGTLFGELLARQFAEMWEKLDHPKLFTLIEAGTHDGQLAADVLGWLCENRHDVFAATRYVIIEPIAALQKLQRRNVKGVQWVKSIGDIRANSIQGCIFCNELLDAFSVRRITFHNGQWHEMSVDWCEGKFHTVIGRPTKSLIPNPQSLPPSYTTEICPAAAKWTQTAARRLKRGWMLFFDYGYEEAEYFTPHRTDGTLLCYYQHHLNNDPLAHIGEQDITAHVNFTAIAHAAERAGAQVAGFTDQEHFVVGAAKEMLKAFSSQPSAFNEKQIRAFKTLMHPEHLGRTMKLLALQKGEKLPRLSGLEFAKTI